MNLYFEQSETGTSKTAGALLGTPGTRAFSTLTYGPVRALSYQNGRMFAVGGNRLYEINSAGVATERGIVMNIGGNDNCLIERSPTQMLIASGSRGYVYDLGANILTEIVNWLDSAGASGIAYINNTFIAAQRGTRKFFYSDLDDAAAWDALNFYTKEGAGDNIVTVFADHLELILMGDQTGELWQNTSDGTDPFQRFQNAFFEVGIAAERSIAQFDNSIIWLGQDKRGGRFVWRAEGYIPKRVSTFALEYSLSTYSTIADAVAFSYTDRGHSFYVLTFPTANATWVMDAASNQWHEREWWDTVHGTPHAVRYRNYCNAFGKHLVGDFQAGGVMELSHEVRTDYNPVTATAGPLRRTRRAPHLSDENRQVTYHRMLLDMSVGEGIPLSGQGVNPLLTLRVSNDGGYTWSNEMEAEAGALGQYDKRVAWNRLGAGRDRVMEVRCSEPIPAVWLAAELELTPGES